jgi:hypothetical protein
MPSSTRPTAALLLAGPALLLAGEVLLTVPDAWTAGHAVFLGGALAMLPAAVVLHGRLAGVGPRWLRGAGLLLTVLGALALAGQFLIDFLVAQLAADQDSIRSALFDRLQDAPLLSLAFYTVGPALLFTGLALSGVAMLTRAATLGRAGWTLVAGTLVMALARIVQARLLEVTGLTVILVALVLVARPAAVERPEPVRV